MSRKMNTLPTLIGVLLFVAGCADFVFAMPSLAMGAPSVGTFFIPSLGGVFFLAMTFLLYGLLTRRTRQVAER